MREPVLGRFLAPLPPATGGADT
ncbi:hypothetical protein FAIPA1_110031 [Frankia sp. AiPs1]